MNVALEIIKKNALSLICLLVAIIAVIAVFWLQNSKFSALQAHLDGRKAEYESLHTLAGKIGARKQPMIDPSQGDPAPLGQFPTERVIEAAQTVTSRVAEESKAVLEEAVKRNEHAPLVSGDLRKPQIATFLNYQTAYQAAIGPESMSSLDPAVRGNTMPVKILKAGLPPTEADIQAEIEKQKQQAMGNMVPGSSNAQQLVDQQVAMLQNSVPEEMRRKVATDSKIYINPDAMDVYPGILGVNQPPPAAVLYFSQVGLWVQQDVCEALADANKDAKNVLDAPVKHFVKIDVNEENGHTNIAQPGQPQPDASQQQQQQHTVTDRKNNAIYDVVPFRLSIIVDATRIPWVLQELSRNRFITVTNMNVTSKDPAQLMLGGYYYGQAQLVQLDLDCEDLFLHAWLQKYMPDEIKGAGAAPTQ
jgi:hypothetical protein